MQHIHLKTVPSTQCYLKDLLTKNQSQDYLISTDFQSKGLGRQNKVWNDFKGSLAFSMTLTPQVKPTLTSLEVAVLIREFFWKYFKKELFLKWPNDLFNSQQKKVAGILIDFVSPQKLIVGIGVNLQTPGAKKLAGLFDSRVSWLSTTRKNLAKDLSFFITTNRLLESETLSKWQRYCSHWNQTVSIQENSSRKKGNFIGLGEYGEALIKNKEGIHKIISGSLSV